MNMLINFFFYGFNLLSLIYDELGVYSASLWASSFYAAELYTKGLLFINLSFLLIILIRLFLIKEKSLYSIKRLSMFLLMSVVEYISLNFIKVPIMYTNFYLLFSFDWFGDIINIKYSVGLDHMGFVFIFLTVFLIPISLIISWRIVYYNTKFFVLLFIILEILLINVFSAIDILLFYISFESILIPMYILIGFWGARERKVHAGYQFFLFTLGGSLFMLMVLIFCLLNIGSTSLHMIANTYISPYTELFIWFGFFIAFAVKIPMMPLHIWLPEAHVESVTGGSVILAGVLLKLGTYGIIRFLIPLFQFGSVFFTPFVFGLSIFGVVYASLTTLRQVDLKKIIAYSSIIHMNFLMFGLFAYNIEGFTGGIILMVAHGFVSGGLFVCIGVLYDRFHTRLKKTYGGLNNYMPIFSIIFLVLTLANISFPGSINFVGEFLVILSIFMKNFFLGIFITFSMIMSTCYSLWLYNKIFSGLNPKIKLYLRGFNGGIALKLLLIERLVYPEGTDINVREFISLAYLIVPVIFLGLFPKRIIDLIEFSMIILLN